MLALVLLLSLNLPLIALSSQTTTLRYSKIKAITKPKLSTNWQPFEAYSSIWTAWSHWSICRDNQQLRVRACSAVKGHKCLGSNQEVRRCQWPTAPLNAIFNSTIANNQSLDNSKAVKWTTKKGQPRASEQLETTRKPPSAKRVHFVKEAEPSRFEAVAQPPTINTSTRLVPIVTADHRSEDEQNVASSDTSHQSSEWSSWSEWSECRCKRMTRTRICIYTQENVLLTIGCSGRSYEIAACNKVDDPMTAKLCEQRKWVS